MKEIKFRAWDKRDNKMRTPDRCGFYVGSSNGLAYDNEIEVCEEFELMQYTGLKDLKGKEIYEGDIVKTYRFNRLIVQWDYDQWGLFDGICNEQSIDDDIEVIGNIYEDANLLK